MRFSFIALSVLLVIARDAAAQLATSPAANPLGTWRGTSRCVARSSGCKDETVVYRIAHKGAGDSLSVDPRTVVDGREKNLGLLTCELNAPRAYITCDIRNGKWRFAVRRDSLIGQLRLHDGTWLLDVHAIRSPEGSW